ncbi:MAG: hypothetical protein JKY09_03515 [Crocinitomicaceae bacterium]|nr:hypothetical protein [Crocinitomicaceae bacterium]
MNEGTAIEIAKQKMRELGICENDYIFRYRHLRIDPLEKRILKGENNLFILISPSYYVKITSKAGEYNMLDTGINEMQHVHRGLITVENLSEKQLDVRFIQIIPLEKRKNK